jgi:hypothetical protein
MTQIDLGNALLMLGGRESGTQHLIEAEAAYRGAMEQCWQMHLPLGYAIATNNLGEALHTLAGC